MGNYPTLEGSAPATAGLQNPDAILGAGRVGGGTAVIYVERQLNASTTNNCANTPSRALTNIVTDKPRKANTDIITIRVATTKDGINFTDVGAASGLQDPTSTAFNALRWLGSGSIVPLSNGHYGLFFGAGNCLDNESDGFHFIGYAETVAEVDKPSDLLNWTIIYGFDNPILSTDTVTDPTTGTSYPANPPLIDVTGANVLAPAQVSPWVPPTVNGITYNANFFSGRVYDPQAIYSEGRTVTIVFERLQYAPTELEPWGLPYDRPISGAVPGWIPRPAPIALIDIESRRKAPDIVSPALALARARWNPNDVARPVRLPATRFSREDDEASDGSLWALRLAIQRELNAQLGLSRRTFRLWQDQEAIAPGRLWESQIQGGSRAGVKRHPELTPWRH
jgi:hypothetical protein